MINNMLRNPAATPPTQSSTDSASTMTSGATALVGVASTLQAPSIKIYKTRQKYNEWEFVFEIKNAANSAAAQPVNPLQPNMGQSGSGPSSSNPSSSSPSSSGQPNPSQPGSVFNPG
jgi:hypothetical protein